MNGWLKTSLIRVLCILLVINVLPGATLYSYAASDISPDTNTLVTHSFDQYGTVSGPPLFIGGTSGTAKLLHAFGQYSIPASGFPSSGKKAALSLTVDRVTNNDPSTYPPVLQVWQYIGSAPFDSSSNGTWPTSMQTLRNSTDYKLLDTKTASDIVAGATVTFDVDQAVKATAGGKLQLLFTGPESSTVTSKRNQIRVAVAPVLTEVAGGTLADASNSQVSVSKSTVLADGSDSATVTVTVKDASNNPLSGKTVTLSKGSGSSVISPSQASTDSNGIATFTVTDTKAEQTTYTAAIAADSVTIGQTASVTFQAGAVSASVSTVAVSKSSVAADGVDSSTVTVTLLDANGNAVSGKDVTLAQGSGQSTITPNSAVTTDVNGQSTFTVKSQKMETVTYTATDSSDSLTITQTKQITFTAGAVNAGQSSVTVSKANVIANNSDSATVTVTLKDINGNSVNNKTVSLTQGSGSSVITATQATTDTSGVATFTVKSSKAEAVTYTAAVTADSVTVAQTASVTFQPGAVSASASTVAVSKSSVGADGVDSATVTVTLKDINGNAISGKNVTLAQGSGQSTITPNSAVITDINGQAVFTVTSQKMETVTYTATDSSDSLTITQTQQITFTAGAVNAGQSSVTVSKANVIANNSDSATVTVTLKDINGNVISGKTVSLTQGSGSSVITATQATTDASGIATFTVNSTKAESVTYTAAVTADAVTVAQTASVTFQPGAVSASASTVVVSKASVGADRVDSATVTVTLQDMNGNAISGKNVTLAQGSGQSNITPNSAVTTDINGQAVFTVTSQKMETVTYTATDSSDSLTITQTQQITFTAGAVNAGQSSVAVSKSTALANGSDSATVTVTLKDTNGNVVSGKTVSLTQGSGSSVITAIQATTDASGVATFTVHSTKAEAVIYTAVAGSVTLILHPVTVTFTPGITDATTSTITASKASVSANATDSSVITVTAKDAYGNVAPGRSVQLLQGMGSSLITSTPAVTNANGIASFVVTNTKTELVTYAAQVITDNVTITQTANVQFLSDNANLASLQLSDGVLIPIFTPGQTSYLASVQNDVYQLTFTPAAADLNATIRINGSTVPSGTASIPINLQTGNNTVTIEVVAADGQTRKTYTVQVMREPNKDARLKALAGSPVAISPAFDPAITQYTVNVANGVDQYRVQADVYNPLSVLTVTGAVYDSSTSNYVSNLQVGSNTITLKVTAQDGQTQSDYTITVIRADALTEVKDALNGLEIGYTGTDTWEFVTNDLKLPTVQSQLPVSWSASQPQLVQSDGHVIRPSTQEGTVILTATIQNNGVAASRTFIVIVKPQSVNLVKTEQTRTVPIRIGESSTDVQQTPITRKTLSNGDTIDKVVADPAQLSSALQAAMINNENSVHIVINDLPAAPAAEVTADVPMTAYDSLADKVNLNIDTDYASVILNKATLEQMKDDAQSLFFRFVPIRQTKQVSLLTQQALDDAQVKQAANNATVSQVGTPMTIETNYKSYNTTLLFPASKLNLPTSSSQQAAYISTLYVYIQHSDGEIELQRGTPQYDRKGNLQGIAIQISKFSTFTILSVQPKQNSSSGGTSSGGGGTTNPGDGQTNPSNPSTPVTPTTPSSPSTESTGTHIAYVKGYPDGTFLPGKTTTRAEVASMLWRIMQANGATATDTLQGYSDVPDNHWAAEAIRELQAKHIMLGVTEDRFAPNRPLTRAEFATLAVRWQQLAPATGDLSTSFKDVKGHWALPSITTLMQTGVVKGYEDGTFRPNGGVTRAELVTMMNRLLKRGPLTGVTTSAWKDVPATHWAFGDIEEASLTHAYTILSDGTERWTSK